MKVHKDSLLKNIFQIQDYITQYKLQFAVTYLLFCIPAFYSEIYDYDYYKYFTKLPAQIALIVWMYNKVEEDENHYSFLALLGLCAAFIAEGFWMFTDEVPYIVGAIQFLTGTFFQGVSSLVNIFSEQPFSKIKRNEYQILIILSSLFIILAYVFAEINSLASTMHWVVQPFWYCNSWMMILQLWRYKRTSKRSYYMGVIGTIFYYVSDIIFILRRVNSLHDWFLNLIWISIHNYGNYFMMKAVIIHMIWYLPRNKQRKEEKQRQEALKWKQKWEDEQRKKTEQEMRKPRRVFPKRNSTDKQQGETKSEQQDSQQQ